MDHCKNVDPLILVFGSALDDFYRRDRPVCILGLDLRTAGTAAAESTDP
jgi:hypothetical protein